MINRLAFEAVDRTLRDITDCPHIPFGGLVVVFGGDFRQTLPVVPRAGHAATVAACASNNLDFGLRLLSCVWSKTCVCRRI